MNIQKLIELVDDLSVPKDEREIARRPRLLSGI